jgi:hypothetical protein
MDLVVEIPRMPAPGETRTDVTLPFATVTNQSVATGATCFTYDAPIRPATRTRPSANCSLSAPLGEQG